MKLTRHEWEARAVAYEEAAEHLGSGQNWTDDKVEFEQGQKLAEKFRAEALKCRAKSKGHNS